MYEREFSLESEHLNQVWSGFISKKKESKVQVDAYQLRNDCTELFGNDFALNIKFRKPFEDVFKRNILGVVVFSPDNETQTTIFEEYINYFAEKMRAGIAEINGLEVYILPPGEISRMFYRNPKKHLLGLFFNPKEEPKLFVDMKNLALPPAVVSAAEKAALKQEPKKNPLEEKLIRIFEFIQDSTNQTGQKLKDIFLGFVEESKFVRENVTSLAKDPQVVSLLEMDEIDTILEEGS